MIQERNEDTIIQRLRMGDGPTIKQIYRKAYLPCEQFIINNSGEKEIARDVFQDSLMVLVKNSRKENFRLTCAVSTYLYSVVRYIWLDRLKKQKKNPEWLIIDDPKVPFISMSEDDIEEKIQEEVKYEQLATALKQISVECQRLLLDIYFQKLSYQEIATNMGYSPKYVKVKKGRCVNMIRKKLGLKIG